MLNILAARQQSLVGIDISSSAVRLLELVKHGEQYSVQSYATDPLPEHAVEGKNIKNVEVVVESVRRVIEKSKTKAKLAAVAVPDSSVITKIVQLEDGLSEDETEELVVLEADKYIPYAIDDVSIDYNIIGPSDKGDTLVDVLVVASRAENVNSRVDVLLQAGLDVKVVDVESYSVERACRLLEDELPDNGEQTTVAVIDIGEVFTHLTVLHDMTAIFSREESFGGRQLTEELVRRYDMSFEEANQAKRKGALPEDYMEEVLEPFKSMVAVQAKRALQFFFSTSQHSSVDCILLAGGTAQLPGLCELIEKEISIPTSLADPLSKMAVTNKQIDIQQISRDAASMMTVCGLALRKFD